MEGKAEEREREFTNKKKENLISKVCKKSHGFFCLFVFISFVVVIVNIQVWVIE